MKFDNLLSAAKLEEICQNLPIKKSYKKEDVIWYLQIRAGVEYIRRSYDHIKYQFQKIKPKTGKYIHYKFTDHFRSSSKYLEDVYDELVCWYYALPPDENECSAMMIDRTFNDLYEFVGEYLLKGDGDLCSIIKGCSIEKAINWDFLGHKDIDLCRNKGITISDIKQLLKFTRDSYIFYQKLLLNIEIVFKNSEYPYSIVDEEGVEWLTDQWRFNGHLEEAREQVNILKYPVEKYSAMIIQHHFRIRLFARKRIRNFLERFLFIPRGLFFKILEKRFETCTIITINKKRKRDI
jgi:hypothetical protein